MDIPVGISACVVGQKVRFDGGHKRSRFVADELAQCFRFEPICPEVGIGLPTPRPTIRLVKREDIIHLVPTKDDGQDFTNKMQRFSEEKIAKLDHLRGYIVCAKSPTCGMERVKLYRPDGQTIAGGTQGLYTAELMRRMPWLPVEEDGRLNDAILRENFVLRVFALDDLYRSTETLSRRAIINFHSRYKLALMAHSPEAYKELGQLVARINDYEPKAFFDKYRLGLMTALKQRAGRKGNTNVLQHLQGHFKRYLTMSQKAELSELIDSYRLGELPLLVPLTLINHYLKEFPDDYLLSQAYLKPYPQQLRLRYGL